MATISDSSTTLFESVSTLNPARIFSVKHSGRSNAPELSRNETMYPLYNSDRHKRRRWPLVLRFYKGAIHAKVFMPVVLHSMFCALIVYVDTSIGEIGLPTSIIPSLSIVVGLMLVFRNQTSYDRFWQGRNLLLECCTSVRNLTRSFLVSSSVVEPRVLLDDHADPGGEDLEFHPSLLCQQADTERTVRLMIAILYAIKHNLRHEYLFPENASSEMPAPLCSHPEFTGLVPMSIAAQEHRGLSLPLQLAVMVESYIRRGVARSWFNGPQSSQLTVQLNTLTAAYGRMEVIRNTPIPVAHLIHMKQVLALYGAVLPFSLVDGFGWYSVPVVAVLMFTLYGIDGIGNQLEDPFGYDKNDIKVDAIVEDTRTECLVLLDMWKHDLRSSRENDCMFR